jgi:hypothetical protein
MLKCHVDLQTAQCGRTSLQVPICISSPYFHPIGTWIYKLQWRCSKALFKVHFTLVWWSLGVGSNPNFTQVLVAYSCGRQKLTLPRPQYPKLKCGAYAPILIFIAILNSYRCVELKIITAKLLPQRIFFICPTCLPKAILKPINMGLGEAYS